MPTTFDDLTIGDSYSTRLHVTDDDLARFAALTNQPIAREQGSITHALLLGYISKILGHDFPGHGTVAVAMNTDFLHAPDVDVEIRFRVEITNKDADRGQVRGQVTASVDDRDLLRGNALLIPPEPERDVV